MCLCEFLQKKGLGRNINAKVIRNTIKSIEILNDFGKDRQQFSQGLFENFQLIKYNCKCVYCVKRTIHFQ